MKNSLKTEQAAHLNNVAAPYDFCLIGSGPAGIILAKELAKTGKKLCIIESGGLTLDERKNPLKKVISLGEIKIKENSRERAWGGTSTIWTGLSAPLDPIDLERWPIKYSELKQYYERLDHYGFPKFKDFHNQPTTPFRGLEAKTFILMEPPLNFGERLSDILKADNVDVLLDSTVIKLNRRDHYIESVSLVNREGDVKEVKAKKFIVCAGGLESTRLLLISHIGNKEVGKYLMNHPKGTFGLLELHKPTKNISCLRLRIREDLQKQLGVLNSYILLEPQLPKTFLGRMLPKLGLSPVKQIRLRNFMEMEPVPNNNMTLSNELDTYGNPLPIVDLNTTESDRRSMIELHKTFGTEVKRLNLGKFISNLESAQPWPITIDASHHLGGTIMGTDSHKSVVDINLKVHDTDNLYICSGSLFPTSGSANPTYTVCALAVRLADHLSR